MRRYEEAIADFSRAIEINPRDSWALSRRGAAYQSLKIFEEAYIDLTHAVEIDPNNAWAWAQRGSLFRQM
jgi:tetratricopeptide (TPR) repeat protein